MTENNGTQINLFERMVDRVSKATAYRVYTRGANYTDPEKTEQEVRTKYAQAEEIATKTLEKIAGYLGRERLGSEDMKSFKQLVSMAMMAAKEDSYLDIGKNIVCDAFEKDQKAALWGVQVARHVMQPSGDPVRAAEGASLLCSLLAKDLVPEADSKKEDVARAFQILLHDKTLSPEENNEEMLKLIRAKPVYASLLEEAANSFSQGLPPGEMFGKRAQGAYDIWVEARKVAAAQTASTCTRPANVVSVRFGGPKPGNK